MALINWLGEQRELAVVMGLARRAQPAKGSRRHRLRRAHERRKRVCVRLVGYGHGQHANRKSLPHQAVFEQRAWHQQALL